MTLSDVIRIVNNKLHNLSVSKQAAIDAGDLDRVVALEEDIASTQNTLNQLQTLV